MVACEADCPHRGTSDLRSQRVQDVLGDIRIIEIANDAVSVVSTVSDTAIIIDGWANWKICGVERIERNHISRIESVVPCLSRRRGESDWPQLVANGPDRKGRANGYKRLHLQRSPIVAQYVIGHN